VRRLAPAALLAVVLALAAGSAHADTFAVVSSETPAVTLPSFTTPNDPSSLSLPFALTTPPSAPEQLSYDQLLGIWQRAGAAYGIQWQVLAAINKVESDFGRNMGPSSAGAIGWMQFMPSTWLRWGTDANGDGVADPWNAEDAIFSAARYLAASGGASDISRAVYSYNHADWYVQEVLGLAQTFGSAGGAVTFSIDRVQQELDAARRAVVRASGRLLAARRVETRLGKTVTRLDRRADQVSLLSDRLALQARAGHLRDVRASAAAVVAARQTALAAAATSLRKAQQAAAGASLQAGTATLMAAPDYSGGYVFPVGGGAGVVSVSHSHHDYPAADIDAPLGSPEYALADGVVVRAWSTPDPRCGIGFTYQAFDGQTWTYCHLAVLDQAVVVGAHLSAGTPVGLVGQTGDATGPHLHLQLQPATGWPQQEPWFESFAGSAFSWQDGGTAAAPPAPVVRALAFAHTPRTAVAETPAAAPAAAPAGPVFAVVPQTPRTRVVLFTRAGG
jgi:murein DD-endopeptidase MepM/ murein hydrolase activator NlpD